MEGQRSLGFSTGLFSQISESQKIISSQNVFFHAGKGTLLGPRARVVAREIRETAARERGAKLRHKRRLVDAVDRRDDRVPEARDLGELRRRRVPGADAPWGRRKRERRDAVGDARRTSTSASGMPQGAATDLSETLPKWYL